MGSLAQRGTPVQLTGLELRLGRVAGWGGASWRRQGGWEAFALARPAPACCAAWPTLPAPLPAPSQRAA